MKQFFIILFLPALLFAQNSNEKVNIKVYKANKILYLFTLSKICYIGSDSSGFYYSCFSNNTNTLLKYDIKENEFSKLNLEDNRESVYLGCDTINKELFLFSYFYSKAEKKIDIFCETIDFKNFKKNNNLRKIAEVDMSDRGAKIENVFILQNNGRLLLRYSCKTNKGSFYGLEVFNKKLEHEWSNYSMAQTEDGYNIESNYVIDNDGNVYAIQRNFEREQNVDKHFERSRVWIVSYLRKSHETKSQLVYLKNNYFINSVQLSLNDKNEIVCAGLYSQSNTSIPIGVFTFMGDKYFSGDKNINYKELPVELVNKGKNIKNDTPQAKKIMKKYKLEKMFGLNLSSIYFYKDGSFSFFAERNFHLFERHNNSGSSYLYSSNFSDDIWTFRFNQDGSVKWVQKIPKYAYLFNNLSQFNNGFFGGYGLIFSKDESFWFLYNNAYYKLQIFKFTANITPIISKLDKDGNVTNIKLPIDNEETNSLAPEYGVMISDHELLVPVLGITRTLGYSTAVTLNGFAVIDIDN